VVPFADGGATSVENLQLRCRAHNAYEAAEWFGPMSVRESPGEWTRSWTELIKEGAMRVRAAGFASGSRAAAPLGTQAFESVATFLGADSLHRTAAMPQQAARTAIISAQKHQGGSAPRGPQSRRPARSV
jgi:hypothetical protein